MHMTNPATGKHSVARGTSLNETAKRHLNALSGNSIGIDCAGRLLNCVFEVWNGKIQSARLGSEDFGTAQTEVSALLNSLAGGAGWGELDLPFSSLGESSPFQVDFKKQWDLIITQHMTVCQTQPTCQMTIACAKKKVPN